MFPTLLSIGSFRVATYGVFVAAGYLAAIWWLSSQRRRMHLSEKQLWDLIYFLFFGAVAGGKLLYWAVSWREIAAGSLHPIRDIRYGFVFYGGFLGAMLMGWVWRRFNPGPYLAVADYFGVGLPIGHALGRLGCFSAGCCAGKPTAMPWGVRFTNPECLVDSRLLGVPIHPTQLYEALANILIAAVVYRGLKRVEKGELRSGTAFLGYTLLYSIARFTNEFFRGDDRGGLFMALSVSQWVALGCAAASIWALAANGIQARRPPAA